MEEELLKQVLFPYSKTRTTQEDMVKNIKDAVEKKKNIIMHAPTGIGKTAATLSPALAYAIKNNNTVFFLTSRQTQHKIAVDTLLKIKQKHNANFTSIDLIGKKYMCGFKDVEGLYANEFIEFCKTQRENSKCEFFNNTKNKNKKTFNAKKVIEDLEKISPSHSEQVIEKCRKNKLCPYEISAMMAGKAEVVIADYNYIFNPSIRDIFFNKTNKNIEDAIIIVDEAHNLAGRIRNILSKKISNIILNNAIREAKKFDYDEVAFDLKKIKEILDEISKDLNLNQEILIKKELFLDKINKIKNYEELIAELDFAADDIREQKKRSYIATVASFLEAWPGSDDGFARILSLKTGKNVLLELSYKCLDASLATLDIIENSHSVICMSGTLSPTSMYKDILGFKDCVEKDYESVFPEKNKASIVIPKTTTKFTERNEQQYKNIAKISSDVINLIPGNSIIFFPSYETRDSVYKHFFDKCNRTIFIENPTMGKEERYELLEDFKKYDNAVLLGVASGSFSQGIDLPGVLKGVMVVGLPLEKPDLETKELINYYDEKFSKGWEYGYVLPAITKAVQAAGRCIRSEKDKGVIIFLDERYAWNNYLKCFPKDLKLRITNDYKNNINKFFNNKI